MSWQLTSGAQPVAQGVRFSVWVPDASTVEVILLDDKAEETAAYPLQKDQHGYFTATVKDLSSDARYMYRLDGQKNRPDPASRYQPVSVHGPSQVVDPTAYQWRHSPDWRGLPLEKMIIYEVHTGTATVSGTFEALIAKLDYIKALGATAIELMPVADFPGERSWGYDGVALYAPARAYGGPLALKRLVDAAHQRGLAVILDVVYNHLGPDGNYLRDFSRAYFTDNLKTPWGDAINYSVPTVREFFINNALYWAHEYRLDGLRLDATHAILDQSVKHFLSELAERVRNSLPKDHHFVIYAEDERNEAALLTPAWAGGIGLDAVWADDFHHEVRSALAGDNEGYYQDYSGSAKDLATILNQGWLYNGQLSAFSGHQRGTPGGHFDPAHFVYCIQNHDQIGNRPLGTRLNHDVSLEAYRMASALLLLSPATPLLFQGQEWAASTPFLFFTDHNSELGARVTEGRREEFKSFSGFMGQEVPDPQALSTFESSKLDWAELEKPPHAQTLTLYHDLLKLRAQYKALNSRSRSSFRAEHLAWDVLLLHYKAEAGEADLVALFNLKGAAQLNLSDYSALHKLASANLLLASNRPEYGGQEDPAATYRNLRDGKILFDEPAAYLFLLAVE